MLVRVIRVLAVLFGIFCLVSSLLDVLGLAPYSETKPPLAQRVIHSLPAVTAGSLLVLPYRILPSRIMRRVIALTLALLVVAMACLAGEGVLGYMEGKKSWHMVPVALSLLALGSSNLWAFMKISAQSAGREASAQRRT